MTHYDIIRAASARKAQERKEADAAVAERIARGGRPVLKPTDLSNDLPERAVTQPVPGAYDDWVCWGAPDNIRFIKNPKASIIGDMPDQPMARALTDAGYMSVPEYLGMYGLFEDDGCVAKTPGST